MKNPRVKESITTLAKRLNEIRRRRPSKEKIDRLNRIFEDIDKAQEQEERERSEHPDKKSARPPEAQA